MAFFLNELELKQLKTVSWRWLSVWFGFMCPCAYSIYVWNAYFTYSAYERTSKTNVIFFRLYLYVPALLLFLSFFLSSSPSLSLSFFPRPSLCLSLPLAIVRPPPLSLSCSFAPLSLGHLLSLSHAFLRMPLYLSKRECNFIYIYGIKIITNSPAMNQIFRFVLQILYAIRKTCIFFNKCEPSSVFTSFAVH